ncbi:glycosyltransferase [Paeniglutamicibacter cryotolerans]
MTSHNGGRFIPQTMDALRAQTRQIDRFIGVDAGSSDGSEELLRAGLPGNAQVLQVPPHSLGASVAAAVAALEPLKPEYEEWLWLIHDDSAPAPDALEILLTTVEATLSVTIAGCKQLDRTSPRRLLDVGLGINKHAERVTLIEIDEVDQGQYDSRTDSFAVNSAGMLIKRSVFEELGGFDPALPGAGDDLDLCWRNRLLGKRVVIVPAAKMFHEPDVVRSLAGPREVRRAEVYLRLKHAPAAKVPFLAIGALIGALCRLVGSLISKDPAYAFSQLGATLSAMSHPVKLARSRRSAAATRKVPRSSIDRLLTDQHLVREHRRHLLQAMDHDEVHGDGTGATAAPSNPSGDARNDFTALATPARTSAAVSAILAVSGALVLSLIGLRSLIGAPALGGGSLLPVSVVPAEILNNAFGWWQSLGVGSPGAGDRFDLLLWLAALLGGGNANQALVLLTLLAMPVAALSAWIGAGAVTSGRAPRLLAGLLWAVSPALQVALGSGRPGAVLVHVLLPLLLLALLRTVGAASPPASDPAAHGSEPVRPGFNGVPSWAAAATASLLLAVMAAASPALAPVALVLLVLFALLLGSRGKTLWWVPLPMLAAALPTVVSAWGNTRALLADPGLPRGFTPAPLWEQVLGFPVAFDPASPLVGIVPGWLPAAPWAMVAALAIGVPVLVLAVCSLFAIGRNGRLAKMMWLVGVLALGAGYGAGFIATSVASGVLVTPFTGPFTSVFAFCMILCAGLGIQHLRTAGNRSHAPEKGHRLVLSTATVMVLVSLAAGSALWLGTWNTAQLVEPVATTTLPATAADRAAGAFEDRSLVIAPGDAGSMTAALMSGGGTTLDSLSGIVAANTLTGSLLAPERRPADGSEELIRQTVATLVSDSAIDPRPALSELGVGFIVLQETTGGIGHLAAQLDAVPGLAPVGRTDAGWLWRVQATGELLGTETVNDSTARVQIRENGKSTTLLPSHRGEVAGAPVAPGDAGRMLVLAERADPGWRATLDGQALPQADSGWAQGFDLGSSSGELTVGHVDFWKYPVMALQGLVLIMALLLAVPVPSRRRFAGRRLVEYRTTGQAESIGDLDAGQAAANVETTEKRTRK